MTSVHFCVLCILFYFWLGLQLMTDFIWLSVIKEPVSHSGSGNLLLLGILQRERQHRYVRHAVQSLSLTSSACRIGWRWRRIYPPPPPPLADITLQWLIQHSKSRRSWKRNLLVARGPRTLLNHPQSSLQLPLWSTSAPFRLLPPHATRPRHRSLLPQLCRLLYSTVPATLLWCLETFSAREGGLFMPITPHCPSLWPFASTR